MALRRDLHAHPELAWQESAPPALVAERLDGPACAVELLPQHRPDRRHRRRRRARWSRCAPTSTRCPVDDRDRRPVGQHRRRASRTPAATTCTPPALLGAGLALAAAHARRRCPGRVRLLFQPAEEVMPGGALEVIARRRPRRRRRASSRCTATRRIDVGTGRAARGPDHRRRRPRSTVRLTGTRRPHLAPAPDRGPDLRARQAGHRAARPCCPAGSTRGPASAWCGAWSAPASAANVIPRDRRASAAPCGCSTRSPGPTPRTLVRDADRRRSSRRTACGAEVDLLARRARRSSTSAGSTALLGRRVERGRSATDGASSTPSRASAARTSPGTSSSVPGAMARLGTRTPGRPDVRPAPGRPATSTSGPSRSAPGCWPRPLAALDARLAHRPVDDTRDRPVATRRRLPRVAGAGLGTRVRAGIRA